MIPVQSTQGVPKFLDFILRRGFFALRLIEGAHDLV
jgi:hypothetical protein